MTFLVDGSSAQSLLEWLYDALSRGDADAIDEILAPDFDGEFAAGMPLGLGGPKAGPVAMREQAWWPLGRAFAVTAKPIEWVPCAGDRMLVIGRYAGLVRASGRPLDAAFAHVWTIVGGRVTALRHFTDTALWNRALADAGAGRCPRRS